MRLRWLMLLSAPLLLTACKDTKAPPKPRVHAVTSRTSSSSVLLTGAAEFGSTINITGGAAAVSGPADPFTAEFEIEVPLKTTIAAGDISVKNTLSVTATDSAGNVSEATVVEVEFGPEPGKPARLSFALTGAADGGVIFAGDLVTYTYSVTDAYGGPVVHPLEVIPSWPGAVVFDDGISGNGQIVGFTRAGDFTITARATGAVGVQQVVPLTVRPASGARYVTMGLTLSRMATGDTTAALTVVKDLYGNVIIDDTDGTSAGLSLTCAPQATGTPGSACTRAGNAFTVTAAGVYAIAATYDDGTNPAATATEYVFVEDVPDVEPPTAQISSILYPGNSVQVPRNGRIDAQLTLTDNRGLNTAVLYAVFGGTPACRANSVTLLLAGATSPVTSASLTVPACAFPGDSILLFVQATDMAGNTAFSPSNTSLSVTNAQLGNLAAAGTSTVAVTGLINNNFNGVDLAFDAPSQTAYVPDNNNQRVLVVLPDRTTASLRDNVGNSYQPNQSVQGVAVAPTGDLFFGRWNTGAITWLSPALPQNPPSLATGLNGPSRMVFDARPATPVLCAAKTGAANSMNCFGFSAASNGSLTRQFTADVVPAPAPGGTNTELAAVAVGAVDGSGNYTLWLLYGGCALYSTTTKFDGTQPATPTAVTVTGSGFANGDTCPDLGALPSGDLVVLNATQRSLVRVSAAGAASPIVTGMSQPTGLDVGSDGNVYVLDRGLVSSAAILKVTP